MKRVHFYKADEDSGAWQRATVEPTDLHRIAALEEWDYRTGQAVAEAIINHGYYIGGHPEEGFWKVEVAE
jgi:hypothetical protein